MQRTFAALDTLGPAADRDALLSFAGPDDNGLPAAALERVRAITAAHDPDGLISRR